MKISYNWLKEYTKIDLPVEEVSEMLTGCGLEVESVETFESIKGGLSSVVIGKVLSCEKHPDADRLSLTSVDVGEEHPLSIVCGASNIAAGQTVVVAKIGATLHPIEGEPFKIKKSKIRGIESEGMICAEDEIGVGTSHAGIMVLKDTIAAGTPASNYFKVETDAIFEIGLTPNRSDATSHIGVARDLVALYNLKYNKNSHLEYPKVDHFNAVGKSIVSVTVEDAKMCPRYTSLFIKNVKVATSPLWLKNKLNAIGIRPINNIVDATQYVLFEMGQPLHAFDADKIKGNKVIVKTCPEGTPFVTLDGVQRKLGSKDLMICNQENPMCIGGVFGGEDSGITDKSCNVFLESAYFNPVSIRKTAKRHGLKTDASFRYERGCDPQITEYAIKRAALLIQELAGGEISQINDFYPTEIKPCVVELSFEKLCRLIGKQISGEEILKVLTAIEIKVISQTPTSAVLQIPTNKVDVTRPADVIEEFLRIYGYNNIELPEKINYSMSFLSEDPLLKIKENISNYLSGNGFCEAMNNSLTKAAYAEKFDFIDNNQSVSMLNPLSHDLQNMRQTMLLSGLENIIENINHGNENLKLYEFGKIYYKNTQAQREDIVTKRFVEKQKLALWITGQKQQESWQEKQTKTDFFFLKNLVINCLEKLNIDWKIFPNFTARSTETLNNELSFNYNDRPLLKIGEVKKDILKSFGIKQEVFYAEIDCELLVAAQKGKKVVFEELNRFPEVLRDIALLIDNQITYQQIETLSFKTEKRYLKSMNLFDVYQGEHLEAGKKSYAMRYVLSNKDKTLTANEIANIMDKLVAAYQKELGAKLR